jgi:hypothetical protein
LSSGSDEWARRTSYSKEGRWIDLVSFLFLSSFLTGPFHHTFGSSLHDNEPTNWPQPPPVSIHDERTSWWLGGPFDKSNRSIGPNNKHDDDANNDEDENDDDDDAVMMTRPYNCDGCPCNRSIEKKRGGVTAARSYNIIGGAE